MTKHFNIHVSLENNVVLCKEYVAIDAVNVVSQINYELKTCDGLLFTEVTGCKTFSVYYPKHRIHSIEIVEDLSR